MKRGASIVSLDVSDPVKPSGDVQPATADAAESGPPAAVVAATEQAEGGPSVDAFADFKQTWQAK